MENKLDNSLTNPLFVSPMSTNFSVVNFRHPNSSDAGSLVTNSALEIGAQVDIITSKQGEIFSDFNYGIIDWRKTLQNKHWLLISSTTVLDGNSPSNAWGASMIFGELEGTKTVMVVDLPEDYSKIPEMWGQIINRIRQIHILFFTKKALDSISKLENTTNPLLLKKIKSKGLVPIVCTYDENESISHIIHPSGELSLKLEYKYPFHLWLAHFINGLSLTSLNHSEIRYAASCIDNSKIQFN
tara:strand:+ start:142 stop:867 length:726 start_codon:yes stop_codon:yes gene_type:complete